jgi:hypothetical protein
LLEPRREVLNNDLRIGHREQDACATSDTLFGPTISHESLKLASVVIG